ncbi:hypothetical protein [Streptomyces sp. ALB3]|uniref:hypothetical protein n=1 Tax=Streptomyces sp. ALB3 TaxID=3374278 RepID=UPI0037B33DCC
MSAARGAVADCLAAGVREIAIVTSQGEGGRQVRHYFTEDHGVRDYFAARGWQKKYEPIAHLHDQADFHFIEQPRDGNRYGTAVPAILAADFIGDQDFFLIAGDDLLLRDRRRIRHPMPAWLSRSACTSAGGRLAPGRRTLGRGLH